MQSGENIKMPCLRPIPIMTKGHPWYKRVFRWFASTRKWEVVEDFPFLFKGVWLLIPKGFVFDGASIPRAFWSFLSPTGLLLIPGLFHDYGYAFDKLWVLVNGKPKVWKDKPGKPFWDKLFLEIGKEVNGVMFADYIAWIAVKVGGFASWANHRDAPGVGMETSDKLPPIEDRGCTPK